MKNVPIFLETLSFLFVTFDLYSQNKTPTQAVTTNKTVISFLGILAMASMIPFFVLAACAIFNGFAINRYYIPIRTFTVSVELILFYITFPILIFMLLVGILNKYYTEKWKSYLLAFGCLLFIFSKSLSIFISN
jgi:hypothetical protein